MNSKYILEAKNITKRFPGVLALDNVSFNLKSGEIHAIVGENGAGKSTLVKIISGVLKEDSGSIFINNEKIKIPNVASARKYGIAYVPQEVELNDHLSIADNLFLGKYPSRLGFINFKELKKRVVEVKNLFGSISDQLEIETLAGYLDIAKKQLVEVLKMFIFDAKIFCMDEPTSSLSVAEKNNLLELLLKIKDRGLSIIYVSHFLDEVFHIADRITVFKDGKYVDTVNKKETTVNDVIKMMVGRELSFLKRIDRSGRITSKEVIKVEDFDSKGKFENISFSLKKGEILGWFGLVGSGRSEVVKSIFGIDPYDSGEIFVYGIKKRINAPRKAISEKIGMVPEERHNQGLVLSMDVKSNINLSVYNLISKIGFVKLKTEKDNAQRYVDNLNIRTASIDVLINKLSGGNQQKVSISKWLNARSEILILDEPTKGVDVGSKNEIYKLIRELADLGTSIIFISSELPEIINLSDRILVFKEGRIVMEFSDIGNVTEHDILKYAI